MAPDLHAVCAHSEFLPTTVAAIVKHSGKDLSAADQLQQICCSSSPSLDSKVHRRSSVETGSL